VTFPFSNWQKQTKLLTFQQWQRFQLPVFSNVEPGTGVPFVLFDQTILDCTRTQFGLVQGRGWWWALMQIDFGLPN